MIYIYIYIDIHPQMHEQGLKRNLKYNFDCFIQPLQNKIMCSIGALKRVCLEIGEPQSGFV
jgi:hypothetical protein